MKKITVLGSTGSIGTQSLEVIKAHPDRFRVEALTCGKNKKKLEEQIEKFRPAFAVTEREEDAHDLMRKFPRTEFSWGEKGLIEAAEGGCDMVLNALMGMRGLAPTYAAIQAGKDIALANKETLVAGGELVMDAAAKAGVKLLPVDSEHSAIFQCLEGNQNRPVKKILLTASGGPFRGYTKEQLENVTLVQALKHPKWNMGAKITIDSATMMNKGLEVIEARWLFDVEAEKIQILVHPQSIVHSAVEFMDNSVIAQLGVPDMRIPISLALGYPDRLKNGERELDFFGEGSNLTFEKPNPEVFGCISLAYEAIARGGSCPAVMNAANEVLVAAFLEEKIRFVDIEKTLACILDAHKTAYNLDLEGILEIDKETRKLTREIL
ncbi:1-deoxy-D-xylulose 5-phosphate reductoisomerase [Firmicutes bacterium CAG:238]|nr:1-deoxy-D-xylulose 5-phosphate reductoisomerase [Firmicutes bacterium CAG:238]